MQYNTLFVDWFSYATLVLDSSSSFGVTKHRLDVLPDIEYKWFPPKIYTNAFAIGMKSDGGMNVVFIRLRGRLEFQIPKRNIKQIPVLGVKD